MVNIKSQKNIIVFTIIFIVATLLMVFMSTPITYTANTGVGGLKEYYGNDGDGAGTKEDPFLIGSYQTLNTTFRYQATMPNMHYVFIDNIDITATEWEPIVSFGEGSVLDGNGFTINNLKIPSTNTNSLKGLFSTLYGSVKNLYFTNIFIQGGTYIGAVAGESAGRDITLDNIRVESGSMTTSTSMSMAGGLVGRLFGSGISNNNRASFIIKNSYTKTSNIQAYNGVGGFIGFIQSGNINITIKNSFHEGNMNATNVYVAGAIGGVSNTLNKTIVIENCYAKGAFTASRYVGGMVGYFNAQAYPTPELFINNCFSQITTTTINATTKGGIFGQATYAGGVFINNCVVVNGAGITKIAGDLSVSQQCEMINSVQELNTQIIADKLNDGANPPNYVIYENRLELRVFDPRIMFVFNSNGGTFPDLENVKVYDLFKNDIFIASTVSVPQRTGYNFTGWNTMEDGSGNNYIGEERIETIDNLSLYANWQIVSYRLSHIGGNTPGQIITFHNENDGTINTATLNQKGYIKTYLGTEDANEHTFNSFLVLKKEYFETEDYQNNDKAWTSIGAGYSVADGNPLLKEQRLNFYDTETGYYLIDKSFIEQYAILNESDIIFIFKPIYHIVEINSFTFDAKIPAQKSYAMVYIDGIYNPYGSKLNYIAPYTNQIEMKIIVNKYRALKEVLVDKNDGNLFNPVENIGQVNNVYTFTFNLVDGMVFELEFESVKFDISVIAQTFDGITLPQELNAIINNGPSQIYLNSSFSNAFASTVAGYRLVNNAVNNIKIFNQLTLIYDYFSAINGSISFASMDAGFLDKYLNFANNSNGEIVIIAEYIQQYILDLEIEFLLEAYGNVTIQITNLQGNTMIVSPSMLGYFDNGSVVKITLEPDDISLIESIENVDADELNDEGNIINFVLDKDRSNIKLTFSVKEYILNVKMLDINENEILDIQPIIEKNDRLYAEDEITLISKSAHPNYEFLGWYALVGEMLHELPPPLNQTIERLILSQSFIENYTDGLEINIVGKFIRLYEMNIIIPTQNTGSFELTVLNEQEGGKQLANNLFREGTLVRITVNPNKHYMLGSVLGLGADDLVQGNNINILVNSTLFITIPFNAIKYDIVQTNDLKDANGEVIMTNTKLTLGEKITLTFKPSSGYDLRSWKINGVDIHELDNAEVNGNNVTLTVTETLLQSLSGNEIRIDNEIKTMMNKTYFSLLLAGGIIIPSLLALIIIVVFLSAKRKKEYDRLMQEQKANERRLASVDFIKNLTNENNDK